MRQDVKSKEAREYMEEFEAFYWGYKHHSPIYVKRSDWEKIKDSAPVGNYIIVEDL